MSFGTNGKVTTSFTGDVSTAHGVAIDTNGKIVVAGFTTGSSAPTDFALARYNADGSLDASFGNGGKLTTDFATRLDYAGSIAIQTDGKIVVAGATASTLGSVYTSDFALARYHADGSLDPSFGNGGKVTTDFESRIDSVSSIVVDRSGKILVAGTTGTAGTSAFAIARYSADGSLDSSFGDRGRVITRLETTGAKASSMTLDRDGRILVAGSTIGFTNERFVMARYTTDGILDVTFDGDGLLTTTIGTGSARARGVAVKDDGKIVIVGTTRSGSDDFALAQYSPDGSLDASFDGDGRQTVDFGGSDDVLSSIAIDSDGNIVAVGWTGDDNPRFALARYKSDGSLDNAFGNGGLKITEFGIHGALAHNVVIDNNGDLIAIGQTQAFIFQSGTTHERSQFALAKYRGTDFVDLKYTASNGSELTVTIGLNGHLQVSLGAVAQPEVAPETIRSLTLTGGDANDSIDLTGLSLSVYPHLKRIFASGGGGNDTIIGSNFNETISGGAGDDLMSGGGGTDRLVEEIAAPSDPAVVSVVKLAATTIKTKYTMTGRGSDTITDFEEMSLAGSAGKDKIDVKKFRGSVTLSGNGGNDTLIGGAGNDSLDGGEGNDKLTGNGGTNQLDGGHGTDDVIEAGATHFVLTPSMLTGLGHETLHSIERASLTTANTSSRIDATAFRGVTILTGGSGHDTLLGGAGKDSISGGDGNDTLIGGNANDTLDGGTGDDALAGQTGHDSLIGGDGQDTLIGGVGHDTLLGGLGDDLLIGGLGRDSLDGEAGNDTGLGGQGGVARGGNGLKNSGDLLTGIEVVDETFANVFAWE